MIALTVAGPTATLLFRSAASSSEPRTSQQMRECVSWQLLVINAHCDVLHGCSQARAVSNANRPGAAVEQCQPAHAAKHQKQTPNQHPGLCNGSESCCDSQKSDISQHASTRICSMRSVVLAFQPVIVQGHVARPGQGHVWCTVHGNLSETLCSPMRTCEKFRKATCSRVLATSAEDVQPLLPISTLTHHLKPKVRHPVVQPGISNTVWHLRQSCSQRPSTWPGTLHCADQTSSFRLRGLMRTCQLGTLME